RERVTGAPLQALTPRAPGPRPGGHRTRWRCRGAAAFRPGTRRRPTSGRRPRCEPRRARPFPAARRSSCAPGRACRGPRRTAGAPQVLPGVVREGTADWRPLARPGHTGRHGAVEVVEIEGFCDVVEGAELEGFLGERDVLVGGDHDDRNVPVELADAAQDLDS